VGTGCDPTGLSSISIPTYGGRDTERYVGLGRSQGLTGPGRGGAIGQAGPRTLRQPAGFKGRGRRVSAATRLVSGRQQRPAGKPRFPAGRPKGMFLVRRKLNGPSAGGGRR